MCYGQREESCWLECNLEAAKGKVQRWFFHAQDFLPVRNTERIFSLLQPLVSQRIPNVPGKFYFLWNYQLLKYIFYPPIEFAFEQHEIGIDFPCLMVVENISHVPALSDCQGHSFLCDIFIMIQLHLKAFNFYKSYTVSVIMFGMYLYPTVGIL